VRRTRALLFGVVLALLPSAPAMAASPQVSATLDGQAIPLSQVSAYSCHDLEFPTIRCFRQSRDRNLALANEAGQLQIAAAAVVYVTVYDQAAYLGSSLSISQNYDSLAVVGWNDRVSSFRARNAETGRFATDWFGGGSSWAFCCNQATANLGTYNNTFSSVYRT
jgi:hypothetical protein